MFSEGTQTPILDANGNGIGNEKADRTMAQQASVGKQLAWLDDIPTIGGLSVKGTVSGEREIRIGEPVNIFVEDVIDLNGIDRVWMVVAPPDIGGGSVEEPETEFASAEFVAAGSNCFETVYNDFDMPGTYMISVFASDTEGMVSLPTMTSVIVQGLSTEHSHYLFFPFVAYDSSWETEIGVVNMSHETVSGSFIAYNEGGIAANSPLTATLAPKARKRLIVGDDFRNADQIRYVEFKSDKSGVAGYQRPFVEPLIRAAIPAVVSGQAEELHVVHIASDEPGGR